MKRKPLHLLQLLEAEEEDALKEAKIKNKTRPAEKGDRKREEKRGKMARCIAKIERIYSKYKREMERKSGRG